MSLIFSSKSVLANGKNYPLIGFPSSQASTVSITDVDVIAYKTAILTNSGIINTQDLLSHEIFVQSLKEDGIWDKLFEVGTYAGDNLNAALVKLKAGVGTSRFLVNNNFVSADYGRTMGLQGNGTTKYLKTGFIPSLIMTKNDTSLGVYNASSVAAVGSMGTYSSSGTTVFDLFYPYSDSTLYVDMYDATVGAGRITSLITNNVKFGLISASRISSTLLSLYKRGIFLTSGVGAVTGNLPATEMYLFARNDSGSAAFFSSYRDTFYFFGKGLTDAEMALLNIHVEALQINLGRV